MDYINEKLKFVVCALFICSVVLCQSMHAAASDDPAVLFQSANKTYADLCRDISKKKIRDNWMRVIDEFAGIADKHPDSSFAPVACYRSAKVSEHFSRYSGRKIDVQEASRAYQEAARKYPRSGIADRALYSAGLLEEKLGNRERAASLYREVLEGYAQGEMAEQAREKLKDGSPAGSLKQKADTDKPKVLAEKRPVRTRPDRDAEKVRPESQDIRTPDAVVLVKKISCSPGQGGFRVEIETDGTAGYTTFVLPGSRKEDRPYRLVMDIRGARISSGIPLRQDIDDGFLKGIRVSQNAGSKVRVVFDLTDKPRYEAATIDDPSRIVVDLSSTGTTPKEASSSQNPVRKVPKGSITQMRDDVPSLASQLGLKVSRIVIDPGHGGKDPGAISPTGVMEKDLTLEIAKILARRLRADGFEVHLTRTRDEFLTLEERTGFANRKKADLFVSLHINSHHNSSVNGIETYFLNLTTDSTAIEVAARENAAAQKSMSDLQLIINDLMLNSKINESSRFANNVQTYVVSSAINIGYEGKNLGVKQAPFYVLLGAQMPSVLLELGFITSPTDISMLKRQAYKETLVDGIAKGINNYIMNTTYAYSWRSK